MARIARSVSGFLGFIPVAPYGLLSSDGRYVLSVRSVGTTSGQLRDNFGTTSGQLRDNFGTTICWRLAGVKCNTSPLGVTHKSLIELVLFRLGAIRCVRLQFAATVGTFIYVRAKAAEVLS